MEETVNKKRGKSLLKEAIMLIPNFLKLMYRLAEDKRVPAQEKAILFATAAYVVSPIDFLPDFIPFVGQVDDLLLVALILQRFMNTVEREILFEYWDGEDKLLAVIENILGFSKFFLPENVYNKVVQRAAKAPADRTFDAEYNVE